MEADEAGALRRAFDRAAMWASENSQVLGERALLTGVGVVSFALGAITSAGMLGFAAFLLFSEMPADVLLLTGAPLGEPVALGGPIVMNTEAELAQAYRELRAGTFLA